jgi:hypothetical protein
MKREYEYAVKKYEGGKASNGKVSMSKFMEIVRCYGN